MHGSQVMTPHSFRHIVCIRVRVELRYLHSEDPGGGAAKVGEMLKVAYVMRLRLHIWARILAPLRD